MSEDKTYTWTGPGGPFSLTVPAGVFTPSSTSRVLGEALHVSPGETVLDVGCGSGVLAFAAARMGARQVVGCDISESAVSCAADNARQLGLSDVTEFRCGSLFEPVSDVRADVIIADISGVPDAIARTSGWFPDGRGGGPTGAELPVAMLRDIKNHITPAGRVYLPTGSIQNERVVLKAAKRVFGDQMRAVATRSFPLPDVVTRAREVADLVADGVVELSRRGTRLFWRLTIWQCGTS